MNLDDFADEAVKNMKVTAPVVEALKKIILSTLTRAVKRARGEAALEERKACAKILDDEVFAILGRGHPEGRAAAHRDAQFVSELAKKVRSRAES